MSNQGRATAPLTNNAMTNKHKDEILRVLRQRMGLIEKIIPNCTDSKRKMWYQGRLEGLFDAYELLTCQEKELLIELNEYEW